MLKENVFEINLFGFTLIELLIVMVISAILGGMGINAYTKTLVVERRQDAILSMQKAMLIILSNRENPICPDPATSSAVVSYKNTKTNPHSCLSSNGFYYIEYDDTGHPIPPNTINNLLNDELLILKATAVPSKSQKNDSSCLNIYLSDQNKIYPYDCRN